MYNPSELIKRLKKENCNILLQIHDELIFESKKDSVEYYTKIIKEEMTSVKESELHSFSIPLLVDINIGKNV